MENNKKLAMCYDPEPDVSSLHPYIFRKLHLNVIIIFCMYFLSSLFIELHF